MPGGITSSKTAAGTPFCPAPTCRAVRSDAYCMSTVIQHLPYHWASVVARGHDHARYHNFEYPIPHPNKIVAETTDGSWRCGRKSLSEDGEDDEDDKDGSSEASLLPASISIAVVNKTLLVNTIHTYLFGKEAHLLSDDPADGYNGRGELRRLHCSVRD